MTQPEEQLPSAASAPPLSADSQREPMPSMPSYFAGYGVLFALIVGFALGMVTLMKVLR